MRKYIDITDIEIPGDENDYDELVSFADAIAEQEIIQLPERKKGKWIDTGSGQECSVCHEIQYGYDSFRYFCAFCGADMRGDLS